MRPSKLSKSADHMSIDIASDMQRFVKLASEAQLWGDNLKARLARAARILRISPRRAKAFYYLEAKVISAQEYMACKQIVEHIQQKASAVRDHHAQASQIGTALHQVDRRPVGDAGRHDPSPLPACGDTAAGTRPADPASER